MDPLSDIVSLLRPKAGVAKPISGRGKWGVSYRPHDAPGFTLVLEGEAWLEFQGQAPLHLTKGDFVLLSTTPAFALYSEPGVDCVPIEPQAEAVRHGAQEGEPDFMALGGSFTFERINAPLLTTLLPDLIHIPASRGRSSRLGRVIELLSEECVADHPGKTLVVERMLEVLLIEALRWGGIGHDGASAGLLRGLRDPGLAHALRAMHGDVRAGWTVAELAGIARMSRSAFAARFSDILGCGPMEYLARWRMALAKDALANGGKSVDRIAQEIGYESASAFSTAFRKRLGCPPRNFARACSIEAVAYVESAATMQSRTHRTSPS